MMDGEFLLMLTSRWLHILSAIVMAGGAIFMRFALLPVLEAQEAGARSELHQAIVGRWRVFIHSGIAISLFTGLYNFYVRFHEVKPMPYHALFGLKFLLAMVVFFIASALVGRSKGLAPMRQKPRLWLNINVALAVIIVMIGGGMRYAPLRVPVEKTETAPPVVQKASTQSPSALVLPVATSNSDSIGTSMAVIAKL